MLATERSLNVGKYYLLPTVSTHVRIIEEACTCAGADPA